MESQSNEVERLLKLLEEIRLVLVGSVPVTVTARKKLSWDDVLPKAKPTTTSAHGIRGRSRLSDQYTRTLRAFRSSH